MGENLPDTFWGLGGGTIVSAGMSAIDIALWDIKGKAFGVLYINCLAERPMTD